MLPAVVVAGRGSVGDTASPFSLFPEILPGGTDWYSETPHEIMFPLCLDLFGSDRSLLIHVERTSKTLTMSKRPSLGDAAPLRNTL